MKAIYQKPNTDLFNITVAQMIAASPALPEKVEEGFNTDSAPETSATSGNLSRKDLWEDENEDEENY
jgi:hypothetical protein